jgi:hypothetical protein
VVKALKRICLSHKERLYLANSSDLIKIIQGIGMIDLYPHLLPKGITTQQEMGNKRGPKDDIMKRMLQAKTVINAYNDKTEHN